MRSFSGGGQKELVKQPKAYGFDTGFVSFARSWDALRPDDCGSLWEHLTLEHLQAHLPDTPVRYWRDKAGNEIDFIIPRTRDTVDVIECKWNPAAFDASALNVFRSYYPKGRNHLVTSVEGPAYAKRFGKLEVTICEPDGIEV
ncbi:MAG: DUF4143 domain-containing protein [Verrucomicrobia bacterium]|nr:DUF4143 domain-containing protein [Verrucomicrobiota bacterium]